MCSGVFHNILKKLETQLGSLIKLEFLSLIGPIRKYANYNTNFPNTIFKNLEQSNVGDEFDFVRLKNELTVLYAYKELLSMIWSIKLKLII